MLTVLQDAGLEFPVIALAKEQKVPKYKLDSLKAAFPRATFYNLNFEVDYDSGKSFNNLHIAGSATKMVMRRATPFYRKVNRLLRRHRPAYCLSFWEPGVATFINVMNCPTKLVSVASQGQIYADDTGCERGLLMRGLKWANVGANGVLVPLSVKEFDGAIPQVVRLPESAPPSDEPYFVAYSTVPQVMGAIGRRFGGRRVRLFVKERRLAFYTAKYRRYPHVEVRPTSSDFADQLARARGLIATPSRGVVTQAIALGKPVYLFCPKGHIEQEYNLRFYMRRFQGVASPKSRRYRRYLGAKRKGRFRNATVTLPDGYSGRLQTLLEWDESIDGLELSEQASSLRRWLGQTDERIRSLLPPLLSPTQAELQAEAEEERAEREEEERERAEMEAEVHAAEVEDEATAEEDDDDDDPEAEEGGVLSSNDGAAASGDGQTAEHGAVAGAAEQMSGMSGHAE